VLTSFLKEVVLRIAGVTLRRFSVRELRCWREYESKELQASSSEEPPRVNMGCFFLPTSILEGWVFAAKLSDVFRIGVGFRFVLERTEVEMLPGSKPRTTLWWLISVEVLASEPAGGLMALLQWLVATVDGNGLETRRAAMGEEAGRGVIVVVVAAWTCCSATGAASCGGSGDSGSMNLFSCIELTTFSRPIGVMCLPRAWLVAESCRRKSGREAEVESDREVVVMALSMLESSEATLDDNSGISAAGNCRSNDHLGSTTLSGWQQKVSRLHKRQAMFSYRFPSSIAGEHRAKTAYVSGDRHDAGGFKPRLNQTSLTGPETKQILRVACLNRAHRTVLYAHHGALGV
jgi:hypothetical protein